MFWGSHIAIPITVGVILDLNTRVRKGKIRFNRYHYIGLGLFGILPDVVDPHIYLHERLNSYSHSIWLLLIIAIASMIICWIYKCDKLYAVLLNLAVGAHLICDGISGGIKPFYPFYNHKIGDYYLAVDYWLHFDVGFIIILLALINIMSKIKITK